MSSDSSELSERRGLSAAICLASSPAGLPSMRGGEGGLVTGPLAGRGRVGWHSRVVSGLVLRARLRHELHAREPPMHAIPRRHAAEGNLVDDSRGVQVLAVQ